MSKCILKSLSLFLIIVLLLPLGLVGCGEEKSSGKILTIAYDKDADTLDHFKTGVYSDALIYVYDRLVTRDYNYNYVPGLAESWDVSDDGTVWTFYLRKGVKFHDGTPLTAEDVAWCIEKIIDPETGSPAQSDFAAVESAKAVDEHTVEIHLKHPFPNLLFILSNTVAGIASKEAYEKYGDEYGSKYLVGSGPYMFEEWKRGEEIVLKKNPDYDWGPEWMENGGKPIIDKLVFKVIPEETTRLMELEAGNVHILRDITANVLLQLEDNEDIQIYSTESTRLGYLAYACDKEPFTDIRVRRALNHAINKEEIIKYVFRDTAQPAYGYLPPKLKDEYYPNSKEEGYEYDVEKAKELLKEAGYGDGLKLTLAAENSTEYSRLAEVIQNQLKEVGIEVDIQLYDSSSYTAMLKEGKQELFLRQYSWPNADILDWFLLSSQLPYPNHSRWNDPKTDELIQRAATMPTWEERALAYHDVQKHLIEQAVWAPIYIPNHSIAVRKEVKNFKHHPWMIQYNDGIDLEN